MLSIFQVTLSLARHTIEIDNQLQKESEASMKISDQLGKRALYSI